MAVLALTFAVLAIQSVEYKIEQQMAPFSYKALPAEKTIEGVKLVFRRDSPVYTSGAQGAGTGSGGQEPPKPASYVRDEAIFLLMSKQHKVEWPASKNDSTTGQAFLGQLDGQYVYAQGPLAEVAYVAKGLPFKGGQDWRDLTAASLALQDRNYRGASGVFFFTRTGDSSLPFLLKALNNKPKSCDALIRAIAETAGPGSLTTLQKLYRSKDEKMVKAAAYGLISSPRKSEARKELLDMLEKGLYVQYVAPLAAQNSWIEAVPILQKIKVSENRFGDLVAVMEAERSLRPSTIHVIKLAYDRVRQNQDPEAKFLKLIVEDTDKEMAAAYALALRGTAIKGDASPMQKAGQTILEKLPKEAIESVKARFQSER